MADKQRLFFALWPDEPVRRALAEAARAAFGAADSRAVAKYHLTLLFLGHLTADERRRAEQAMAGIRGEPLALSIDRTGAFGKVLWLGPSVVPPALSELAAQLRAAAAAARVPHDDRPFAPHVTCLRDAARRAGVDRIAPVAWPVRDFALMHSVRGDGGGYRVVGRWPLGPG